MGFLWKKKKEKKLFGNNIEVNCNYCTHYVTTQEEPICSFKHLPDESGRCPYFCYDPLMREPINLPPLREYDADDFKL